MAEYQWTYNIFWLRIGLLKYNLAKELYKTWLYIYKADEFQMWIGRLEIYVA